MSKRKLPRWVIVVLAMAGIVILAGTFLPVFKERENPHRVRCAGNLKQIGLALLMYSGDNGGYLPNQVAPGSRSFETLSQLDILTSDKAYTCPYIKPLPRFWESPHVATANHSDYVYVGSGLKDDNNVASMVRIAFDASGNHPNNAWMNVLFLDGHAEGARPDGSKGWNTYDSLSPDPDGRAAREAARLDALAAAPPAKAPNTEPSVPKNASDTQAESEQEPEQGRAEP